MAGSPRLRFARRQYAKRTGNALTFSLVALVVVAGLGFGGWWLYRSQAAEESQDLILQTVSRGPYDFVVIEQGTVESATNVELRCEVRSRGGGGGDSMRGGSSGMGGGSVSIIDVIPEGTMVQPGDQPVDIGPKTIALIQEKLGQLASQGAGTIVFQSGIFSYGDDPRFQGGTQAVAGELQRLAQGEMKVYINDGSTIFDAPSSIVPIANSRFAQGNFSAPRFEGQLPSDPSSQEAMDAKEAKLVLWCGKIDKNRLEGRRDMLDELQDIVARGTVRMVIGGGAIGMALKKAEAQLSKKDVCLGTYDNTAHKDYIPLDRLEQARAIITEGLKKKVEFATPIDFVLADGREVENLKMADLVLQLDSSALELEAETQQTRVNVQKAQVVQSDNGLTAAKIARLEYLEGTFVSSEKEILAQLFAAQQTLKTSNSNLEAAKNLMAKGIATALQVEAAQFSVDDATKKYEVQETRLKTLREYTKAKELTKFDSDIDTAQQRVQLEKNTLQVEEKKLLDVKSQVGKCTIWAPSSGQVVYANETDAFRGGSQSQFIVTPGAMVRERQVLIRLPNAADMQVRATVNEARITLVRPGLPVSIRVDALRDDVVNGEVIKVNQYAESSGFSTGNIKRYATIIKITNPPPGLRVGMNAEVRIHVERKQEALQVPVQALAEYKNHFFTVVQNGEDYVTREVKISSTNDKVATIEDGLKEGDVVVMNPRGAGGLLVLPNLPDPNPISVTEDIVRAQAGPVTTLAAMNAGGPPAAGAPAAPGAPGAEGGQGGKKGKGKGNFSPASLVQRYLQSDADKDEKLSKEEVSAMDERARETMSTADKNGDGFVDKTEMTSVANAAFQKMREGKQGGGGGGGGRPPRGGGEGGGGQFGPSGGGE